MADSVNSEISLNNHFGSTSFDWNQKPSICESSFYQNSYFEPNLKYSIFLNSAKPIHVLIFFIDFEDHALQSIKVPNFASLEAEISKYFAWESNRKISFVWQDSKFYFRMPKKLQDYGNGTRENLDPNVQMLRDAESLAFDSFKLQDIDYFILVPPNLSSKNQFPISFSVLKSNDEFPNSAFVGHDFWTTEQSWTILAHEIGHAFGLIDLYSYESAANSGFKVFSYLDQFKYMKFYDLMNWPTGPAPSFTVWNRIQMGFLKPGQYRCLPPQQSETPLIPVEAPDFGFKGLFLKIEDSMNLVVENRQQIGFDQHLPVYARGVIIYIVNFEKHSGYGPLQLLKINENRGLSYPYILQPKMSKVFRNFKIECSSINKNIALIRVTKLD